MCFLSLFLKEDSMIFELLNYNCDYPSKKGGGGVEDYCNMIGCYYNKVSLLVCLLIGS